MSFLDKFLQKGASKDELVSTVEGMFDVDKDISRRIMERIWWRNILYYCMAEGTTVPLLDGSEVPIEALPEGELIWAYGLDTKNSTIIPVELFSVGETGIKPCVEVILDNGNTFTCTADHRILTWQGYKEASALSIGEPLIPWRSKYFKSAGKGATGGYNQIFQPYDAKWEQTHRVVAREIYGDTKGYVVHHLNANKVDNRPENLELMSARDHSILTLEKHKDKILAGMTAYARSNEGRKRKALSAKRQWEEGRDKMLQAVRGYRRDEEYLNKVSEGVKRSWKKRYAEMGEAINCRVAAIRPVGMRRVYDAIVPKTSNFAISAGCFVHNCGEQWIEWVKNSSSFRRRILYGQSETPVSNEIREFVRSVKAMLLNQTLVPRVVPNSEERVDIDAAEVGKDLLIHMDSINDWEIEDEKELVTIGVAVFGTVFMRTIPDKAGGEWFIDKQGNVKTTGEVSSECVLPFNVVVDHLGNRLHKKRWVGLQSLRSKEWVEDTFKIKVDDPDAVSSIDYQRRLMSLVGQVSPWKGSGLDYISSDTPNEDLVAFKEVEFRPNKAYPNGRYVVVCGHKLVLDVPRLPIVAEKGTWMYSLVDFHYNYLPGRFWSDSGVDDLISPQNTINDIDKSLKENRKSLGRTTVIMPNEPSLKRLSDKEDQVLVLQYDALLSGGARPVFQQGIPLPDQTLQERIIHKQQIQELGGDPKNVLKGQAPSAHASGVMTDILRETAERGHQPDIERFNRAMQRVYKARLLVAKEVYTEERIIKVKGRGNTVKVRAFRASDLHNNTDVRMELDSGLATTKAGQREVLMGLMEKGFFQPGGVDPALRHEILTRLGLSGFTDPTNVDNARAERENGMLAAGSVEGIFTVTTPVTLDSEVVEDDPLFKYDNHVLHYESHRRFILSPEFQDMPLTVQAAAIVHNDVHNLQVKAAQAVQQQAAMNAQSGGQQGGGRQPQQPGVDEGAVPMLEGGGGGV